MKLDKNREYYSTAVRNCERNISYVENSNFSLREKAELKASYLSQIRHYKRQMASLYKGSKPIEF